MQGSTANKLSHIKYCIGIGAWNIFYDVIPKRALLLFSKEYIIIWPNLNVVYVQGTTGSTRLEWLDQFNKNMQLH